MISNEIAALRGICPNIVDRAMKKEDWRATESDDEFQIGPFVGGFDATEDAFCFTYHSPSDGEQWFQLTLEEAAALAAGSVPVPALHPAR